MKTFKFINNKSAIIFGMDARIALVIVSIVSLAIAVNRISLKESKKLQDVTLNVFRLQEHILDYYANNHTDLSELETIYSQSADVQNAFFSGINNIKYDPWGAEWKFKVFASSGLQALGDSVIAKCIVIFSAGADRYHHIHTNYSAASYTDCIDNVDLPSTLTSSTVSDDYFYKFTTIGYDIQSVQKANNQLEELTDALNAYAEAKLNARIQYCTDLGQSAADADSTCDLDASGVYAQSELESANFYPKSASDATGAIYATSTTYDNTDDTQMQNLMTELSLPLAYRIDDLGRTLNYNSNSTGVLVAPFVATVTYTN